MTARFFVDYEIAHPRRMVGFLVLTAVTFSLFGLLLGAWADWFEKLQVMPMMSITPLAFLGGTFYGLACEQAARRGCRMGFTAVASSATPARLVGEFLCETAPSQLGTADALTSR